MRSIILIPLLVGCEVVESTDVNSSGIYADLFVMAEGSGTSHASATLRVGGATSNTFVELSGADTLTSWRTDEEPQLMVEQALFDMRSYRADFVDDTPDLDVHISFDRTTDAGAPGSVMSLPLPFELDPIEASYSRLDDDIVLAWDNVQSEEMQVFVEGDCIRSLYLPREADTGTWTLDRGVIEPFDAGAEPNCEVTLSVWRSRPGSVDPGYGKGGVAWGHQKRQLTFTSTP